MVIIFLDPSMSKYDVKRMTATLGDHNIRSGTDGDLKVRVLRVIRHKRFSTSTLVNLEKHYLDFFR